MTEIFKPLKLNIHEYGYLLCPQCGCECVHISKTTANLQDVDALQFSIEKKNNKHVGILELKHEIGQGGGGYDYAINLWYYCENGCEGIIKIHHHEGNTFLWHKAIKTYHPEETKNVL
jgi:hypothetical protein